MEMGDAPPFHIHVRLSLATVAGLAMGLHLFQV